MKTLDEWLKEKFNKKTSSKNSKKSKTNVSSKKETLKTKKYKKNDKKKSDIKKSNNYKAVKKTNKKPAKQVFKSKKGQLKIIPIGGLNEVGKNMMALEYEDDIIIVDMGFEFPNEDMLGIDYIIPDVSYLEERIDKIRGVVITHGHLDHIGGIPYILPKLNFPPLFATKLTMGLIMKKIEEFKLKDFAKLNTFDPKDSFQLGKFKIEPFRVTHSIPDSVGLAITTPAGKIVHTGDFKFDDKPLGLYNKADEEKMRAIGRTNVLALFSDSTNALKPGKTMSEQQVAKTLEEIIKKTDKRLIIASFSSLIGRIQQILTFAERYNRKVYVSGRSMQNNIEIAKRLGFIKFPKGLVSDIKKYKGEADENTLILTTGSQGEAVSALTRIANNDHKHIKIKKGDTVVLSSSPIIGNERAIATVINSLCVLGANVIHKQLMDVHTSGHGHQEDLKKMIRLIKPKYFIPIHGEYFMRKAHADLASKECQIPENRTIMLENGSMLLAEKGRLELSKEKVDTKYILIDGFGEGFIGSRVQEDRMLMSQNGALIVLIKVSKKSMSLKGHIDVLSRGFIYMHETDEIVDEIKKLTEDAFRRLKKKNKKADRHDIKRYIKQSIDKYTHQKLERHPLIIPILVEQ